MKQRKGRMINRDISNSRRFASLSPEASVLFVMLIPHYNSHGKMNGGIGYIKDEICPFIKYLNSNTIPRLLTEISEKTNVKWFEYNGRCWIHSINFLSEHQDLDKSKLGKDLLPDFSMTTQNSVCPEVEVEVEDKDKVEKPEPILFDLEAEFQKRWEKYPNKDGRKEAFRHFTATVTQNNISDLDKALDNYLVHLALPKNSFKQPKNGKTWFNNWKDWIDWNEPTIKQSTTSGSKDAAGRELKIL